jgi:hypothetical protein
VNLSSCEILEVFLIGMNYACTYLGEWEQELFDKSDRLPTHYWRYVDDAYGACGAVKKNGTQC